ncbi:unnamed protein product [Camellia sinensis]
MDRAVLAISSSAFLCLFLVFSRLFQASGNAEVDALNVLKTNLADPKNVLQSWNATPVNPYTWFHITCNSENSVTRVDRGNANLSGQLVPQLGLLLNLQYFKEQMAKGAYSCALNDLGYLLLGHSQELHNNSISGRIPIELGNLTSLVSLDLYLNNLSGIIPNTLGRILHTRELYSNNISGRIPIELGNLTSLVSLDLYLNNLNGIIPDTLGRMESRSSATGAIAGGVVASAALLFLALAWWWRRKPEDSFFDVPAEEGPEVHLEQLKRFSLRELQVATDNFSNINILGRGGFGKEYKGRLADGSLVAVKILKEERA